MMDNCLNIRDRVAVVIGGTSGLGRALAVGMARHGADVVATGRRIERVESAAREIEAAGRKTLVMSCDVTNRKSIDALRDAVLERFGRVDILVNAAGHTFREPTATVGQAEWEKLMDTNLTGVLRACQSFHDALAHSGRGRIVNIASLGSFAAFHQVAAYCAAKSGLLSLTRSLACEWAQEGLSVNAIAPGIFPTEMNEDLVSGTARGRELLIRTPMRRFGRPEELVGAAVLLASDAASFLTGQCIAVDGGYLASGVNS
jgi:NAD(P)-dependent dehydrogenase (short-subunit alcohol dehydrogenase family)